MKIKMPIKNVLRNVSLSTVAYTSLLSFGSLPHFAYAVGLTDYQRGLNWSESHNISDAEFQDTYIDGINKNLMMTDIDVFITDAGKVSYSAIWQENTKQEEWAVKRHFTDDSIDQLNQDMRTLGYRLIDQESYIKDETKYWVTLWLKNTADLKWGYAHDVSREELDQTFFDLLFSNQRLIDIEVKNSEDDISYSYVWVENWDNRKWRLLQDGNLEGFHLDGYTATVPEEDAEIIVDFEAYKGLDGKPLYLTIQEKRPDFQGRTTTERAYVDAEAQHHKHIDAGYRLIDFNRYETPEGIKYASVWLENEERYRYTKKQQLDEAILHYSELNNLPGISVAIIKDGESLYQKGFGFSDINSGLITHTKTTYNAASISKLIGGTLSVKLESEKQLRDGTLFEFDISAPTADYIDGLPEHHQHHIYHLFSHLSCVPHYAEIGNQTTHYSSATAAVQSIWNKPILKGCNPGEIWYYSTHAFTYAAAALEGATGRSVNDLLKYELFEPYGLDSMRVQYETEQLSENSQRATPYTTLYPINNFLNPPNGYANPNIPTHYQDSSWKVFGGGIESNVYDIAKFGWQVLNAEIVTEDVRDQRLWFPVVSYIKNSGIGWILAEDPKERRIAEWTGNWTGARNILRAYRDDGLVIAVMSNRNLHRFDQSQDVQQLADQLGDIILGSSDDPVVPPQNQAVLEFRSRLDTSMAEFNEHIEVLDNDSTLTVEALESAALALEAEYLTVIDQETSATLSNGVIEAEVLQAIYQEYKDRIRANVESLLHVRSLDDTQSDLDAIVQDLNAQLTHLTLNSLGNDALDSAVKLVHIESLGAVYDIVNTDISEGLNEIKLQALRENYLQQVNTIISQFLRDNGRQSSCPEGVIDLDQVALRSYSDQNIDNHYYIVESGCSIYMTDNTWLETSTSYEITPNTVLYFGYEGSQQGELHGIGFEDDNIFTSSQFFRVDGLQENFGVKSYRYDNEQGGYQSFRIPVGQHLTGNYRLVLMMDQDINTGGNSYFAHIRLSEEPAEPEAPTVSEVSTN